MTEAEKILQDWEDQAREMDIRNPMRAQILGEAAVLRSVLADNAKLRAALAAFVDHEGFNPRYISVDLSQKLDRARAALESRHD